jgi:flagellar FliL protein
MSFSLSNKLIDNFIMAEEINNTNEPNIESTPIVDGQAIPKKKKKKTLIVILLIALSICGGVGGYITTQKKKKPEGEEKPKEAVAKTVFYDMDEIIVNLNTSGKGVSFLKLRLTLEVTKAADIKALDELMPKIQDALQLYLRELRPIDLQGSVGLYRLREEILLRINKVVYPAQVSDILFKDVLVQ